MWIIFCFLIIKYTIMVVLVTTFPYGHPYYDAYTKWLNGLIDAGYFNGNGELEFNKLCS